MVSIKCGHCERTHASVAEVRQCAAVGPAIVSQETESIAPAKGRVYLSVPYIEKNQVKELGGKWDAALRHWWVPVRTFAADPDAYAEWPMVENPAAPKPKAQKNKLVEAEEGFYEYSGEIYRVVRAVHGSGRLYTQKLIGTIHEDGQLEGRPRGSWRRVPGMKYNLKPEHRMSVDRMKYLGALYGFCIRCGLTLTDPESIERGMGPYCALKG